MKKNKMKKVVYNSLFILGFALFVASTIVFFVNRGNIKYFSISYDSYNNIENFSGFQEAVEKNTGIDFENILIKNGGEIRTNFNGNITYLNLDCIADQADNRISLQIQNNKEKEYKLIVEKNDGLKEEKISAKEILEMISFWDFNSNDFNAEYKFMIDGELIQNIQINRSVKQYIFFENRIEELKNDLNGQFSRITILCNDSFQELYCQVK